MWMHDPTLRGTDCMMEEQWKSINHLSATGRNEVDWGPKKLQHNTQKKGTRGRRVGEGRRRVPYQCLTCHLHLYVEPSSFSLLGADCWLKDLSGAEILRAQHTTSQELLQILVNSLYLFIGLRVYVVLVRRVVLLNLNNSFPKLLVKILSLSDTIDLGIPWCFTTPSIIACAICWAEKWVLERDKCAYLDNLSTTTKIVLKPSDFGRPSIKSIEMSFKTPCATGKGRNNPAGCTLSDLACWQMLHCLTKLSTSPLSPFHTKCFLILW
jgi:hypothetical protein